MANLKWLWIAILIIALDQITKYAVSRYLQVPISLMPGLNLTLVHNTGAAFGFLDQAGGWQRWFLTGVAIAVSCFILIWLYSLPVNQNWSACALALILGGAIGNVWDRIFHGHVIDFIDISLSFLPWKIVNPWPTFNIADSAICVGAAMLIIGAICFTNNE